VRATSDETCSADRVDEAMARRLLLRFPLEVLDVAETVVAGEDLPRQRFQLQNSRLTGAPPRAATTRSRVYGTRRRRSWGRPQDHCGEGHPSHRSCTEGMGGVRAREGEAGAAGLAT
jgi:hypothetical protein